jgi:hypothetical protein
MKFTEPPSSGSSPFAFIISNPARCENLNDVTAAAGYPFTDLIVLPF